jgi:NADH dehydrogenase FAD-containing subunit
MLDTIILLLKVLHYGISSSFERLKFLSVAKFHRLTCKVVDNPKNVIVLGGSFAGYFAAKHLAESLPQEYRVILIERNSHFHFTWNFPRISIVPGHDYKAFVPYPKELASAPDGAYVFRQATVTSIDSDRVFLEDGTEYQYAYLVIATGSQKRYPARLEATEKVECMDFFQDRQEKIKKAQDIVVVGGGAAGVEVASDAKSKYPEKNVTIIHSRDYLLNNFGTGLHKRAKAALDSLGVNLYLGERVVSSLDEQCPEAVTLTSGTMVKCDMLVRVYLS